MPATSTVPTQAATYVKISPANFMNTSVQLNPQFIAEAIEYYVNPYEIGNKNNIASGIIEFSLYNQLRTETDNVITKVDVQNLTVPI